MPGLGTLPIAGGMYRTTRHGDKIVVHDVPILGFLPANAPGRKNPVPIDRRWMEAALRDAQLNELGGYLPPLHYCHHDDKSAVVYGGHFQPKRVGQVVYRGDATPAMFGTLFPNSRFSREMIEAAERGEMAYPYCSVEVGPDWHTPEVLSLALLDHEPPHYMFPMISLDLSDGGAADEDESQQFRRHGVGRGHRFSYRFEATMADTATKDAKDEKKDGAQFAAVDVADAVEPGTNDAEASASDDELSPAEMSRMMRQMAAKVDALDAKVNGEQKMQNDAGDQPDAVPMPAPGEEEMEDMPPQFKAQFSRMRNQLATLQRERDDARKAAEKQQKRERAFGRLRTVGLDPTQDRNLAADVDAAIDAGSEEILVRSLMRNGSRVATYDDTIGSGSFGDGSTVEEPWARNFSRHGANADHLHEATQLRRTWEARRKLGDTMSWQQFLQIDAPELAQYAAEDKG